MMSSGVGGVAGMAMLVLVMTSLIAVSARPNQGLFLDDMRRPVYRGKQRYISNSSSFVRGETLGKTNNSYIISIKLLKRQNQIVNQTKSNYRFTSKSLYHNTTQRKNGTRPSFFFISQNISALDNDNNKRELSEMKHNNTSFYTFDNQLNAEENSNHVRRFHDILMPKSKGQNRVSPEWENINRAKESISEHSAIYNDTVGTYYENINKTARTNNVIKRRNKIRVKVSNNRTFNANKPDDKSLNIDSHELVHNFISNSIKTLDVKKPEKISVASHEPVKSSNSTSLLESLHGLADSVNGTQSKRPILIYPQGQPPNWTENPHDSSFILIEDILDPSLLPKPQESYNNYSVELSSQKTPNTSNDFHLNNLKEYLHYLTSSSKPSSIPANLKPNLFNPHTTSDATSKITSSTLDNFVPIKPFKVHKRPLITKINSNKIQNILPPPTTTKPILISFKPSFDFSPQIIKNHTSLTHSTETDFPFLHVSTASPPNNLLHIKPTLYPHISNSVLQLSSTQSNSEPNKHHYIYHPPITSVHAPNRIKPQINPYYEYPKPDTTSGWWTNIESSTSETWPVGHSEPSSKPEVTTGSWTTVAEGEKLERPLYVHPPTSAYPLPELSSSPLRPIYSFKPPHSPNQKYPKPPKPISEPTNVHKPLYVYVPPQSTPVYKPIYLMPYPGEKVPVSADVTPAPLPVAITRPSPVDDEYHVPAVPGFANPPLGPTIILTPVEDESFPIPPPSRPPAPSIVIIETFSDPAFSDDPPNISPLQDPLPEECRSIRIKVNGSSTSDAATNRNCPVNIIINNVPQGTTLHGFAGNPVSPITPILQPLAGLLPLNGTNILSGNNISPVTQADVAVTTTNSPTSSSASYMDYFYTYLPFFNPILYPIFIIFLGPIKVLVLGAFILAGFLFPVMIFRAILGLFLG